MQQLSIIVNQNRKILYKYLTGLSDDELFTIPKGFNNNIWWNIAHVVVTQQKLVYGLSGLPLNISQQLVEDYQKGSFPKEKPNQEEVEEIKRLLFELPEKTQADYDAGLFTNFKSYMTTPKVELNSVEDAMAFNVFHEGLHLGSIMAILRAVKA
ncbi:DinB family protein [Croceivirga thetidis]|uniref:DinB family protein n=1 Tax=Croceivirga thetidis TaxID=2721623 RepID=A0ABX1GND0_9FLAO|nr:DinB family protein [Croceivirga thetidis]NKI31441.1 DinB family protein [Croceivirga thetidis]